MDSLTLYPAIKCTFRSALFTCTNNSGVIINVSANVTLIKIIIHTILVTMVMLVQIVSLVYEFLGIDVIELDEFVTFSGGH